MDQVELFDHIKTLARDLGIVDISVAKTESWETDPLVKQRISKSARPTTLMPSARSVIVIGIPIQRTIIETAPSIYYHQLYDTVNTMLDQASERIALELNILGHDAVYVPRDGYHGLAGLREIPNAFFSQRHAAYLAGLGTFGFNNVLLTKKYGPRIRWSSVITSAELPSSEPMSEQLCIRCGKCTKACPASAVSDKDYPIGITMKQSCVEYAATLAEKGISPCGRCICVCPVGDDRKTEPPEKSAIDNIQKYVKPPKKG